MIIHRLDTRHDLATLTPETPDDLWTIRRVISKGDLVASESSRVLKETSEYARPDKERVKVTITVEVEQVKLDSTLSRLRISGKIVDVSNDVLTKNAFHSLSISEGRRLSIRKPNGFSSVQLKLVEGSKFASDSYVIIALDMREAGIGVVKGTHLQILPTIDSGLSGKMYQESKRKPTSYFDGIKSALSIVYPAGSIIFVLGPGNTKNSFANFLSNQKEFSKAVSLEGSDVAGEDGVYVALRNKNLQDALGESRLSNASKVVQEVMRRISLGDSRVSIAFSDSLAAAKAGAIESLLVSEKIFSQENVEEDDLVDLLNTVEEFRGETFLLDSSTDLGNQVNVLGGVVGLLRFANKV
ncbi:MAG: pelota family protein [Nitrososphaerales archaeon]